LNASTLLSAARRRIAVVALCAVFVPAAALGYSLRQDKEYTAAAQLLFRDAGFDEKIFGSSVLEPSVSPERQAATNVLLVSNKRVAERTAKALGRGLTGAAVASRLEVTQEGQADVISVAMTASDPQRAAQLANAYANEFIRFRRDADRNKIAETRDLVDRQLEQLGSRTDNPAAQDLRRQADQLKVLASLQTGNAELAQAAEPPGAPSSPRTVRNVAFAVFVGLLMGLALAFAMERLDRRLRDPEEIEQAFGRPILGTVPESRSLGQAGPALAGIPGWAESESFSMIRANLRYFNVGHPTKSVLVTSASPGDGKTTIAWNLAAAAVTAGDRVLVIEADLRHPSRIDAPGQEPSPGLGTYLAGNAAIGDLIVQLPVPSTRGDSEPSRHMDVVPAGAVPPNPIDLLESDRMRTLISDSEKRYDLVVVDTAPTAVVSDAIPLMKWVSGVIVVTRLGKSTRASIQQLRRQLENLEAPTLGIVVNSVEAPTYSYGYGYGYGHTPGGGAAPSNGKASRGSDKSVPARAD
jgi:capsular exopolysaccharide synthesis family protein